MDKPAAAATRPLRILIAEDDALIGMAMEWRLSERGHEVSMARDGQEALKAASQNGSFDVLVTDAHMPHISGDELVVRLRSLHPHLPIVVISANAYPDKAEALRAVGGPISILTKPVAIAQIADEVERLGSFESGN